MNRPFIRNWIGFFILGTINNLFYVIVNSSALVLASSYGVPNLVAVVPWANTGLGFFVKCLNTFVLIKVPYGIRFSVNVIVLIGGLLGIAFAPNFYVTILCILMTGLTSSFGESVALEYLQRFDSRLINAWGSGTGFAGVLGGSLYILFTCVAFEATLNDQSIDNTQRMKYMDDLAFWCSSPLPLLALIAYFVVIKKPRSQSTDRSGDSTANQSFDSPQILSHSTQDTKSQMSEMENYGNLTLKQSTNLATYWKGFRATLWLSLNLTSVFFLEYLIRTYAAKSRPSYDFHPSCPELYSALQLSYQFGVFVSRSSLQLVKIKQVEILTILQTVNMLIWFINIFFKFLPLPLLPFLMLYVGVLGGCSYVNVFYRIKTEHKYAFNRQVCINISSLWIAVGIFSATAIDTLFNVTFLKEY